MRRPLHSDCIGSIVDRCVDVVVVIDLNGLINVAIYVMWRLSNDICRYKIVLIGVWWYWVSMRIFVNGVCQIIIGKGIRIFWMVHGTIGMIDGVVWTGKFLPVMESLGFAWAIMKGSILIWRHYFSFIQIACGRSMSYYWVQVAWAWINGKGVSRHYMNVWVDSLSSCEDFGLFKVRRTHVLIVHGPTSYE